MSTLRMIAECVGWICMTLCCATSLLIALAWMINRVWRQIDMNSKGIAMTWMARKQSKKGCSNANQRQG